VGRADVFDEEFLLVKQDTIFDRSVFLAYDTRKKNELRIVYFVESQTWIAYRVKTITLKRGAA
jgi:hypothetical protein